jgi:5-(carboxyamino)imidazole ribonucleotide synthase
LNYVGVLGVNFSSAPSCWRMNGARRTSAHYTIDACLTNQFEQQVRTLCGLPLGEPRAHFAAVMVNLLGDLWRGSEPDWATLLAEPRLRLHLYGKHHARPGRKMGHFTVVGGEAGRAIEVALAARRRIGIAD